MFYFVLGHPQGNHCSCTGFSSCIFITMKSHVCYEWVQSCYLYYGRTGWKGRDSASQYTVQCKCPVSLLSSLHSLLVHSSPAAEYIRYRPQFCPCVSFAVKCKHSAADVLNTEQRTSSKTLLLKKTCNNRISLTMHRTFACTT